MPEAGEGSILHREKEERVRESERQTERGRHKAEGRDREGEKARQVVKVHAIHGVV